MLPCTYTVFMYIHTYIHTILYYTILYYTILYYAILYVIPSMRRNELLGGGLAIIHTHWAFKFTQTHKRLHRCVCTDTDIFKAIQVIDTPTSIPLIPPTISMTLYIVGGLSMSVVIEQYRSGCSPADGMPANARLSYSCPPTWVPNWPSVSPPKILV